MAWAAIAILLVVMVVVSVHWLRLIESRSQSPSTVSAEPTATGTPTTSESTSPTASPSTDTPSEVGQTRAGENSDTTLLHVRKVVAPAGREPGAGREWLGIRAETCVHPDAAPSGAVGWSSWLAATDAGTTYRGEDAPWDDFPPQQFGGIRIEPGDCNVGWILIAIPEGAWKQIESVTFRPKAPEPATWAV